MLLGANLINNLLLCLRSLLLVQQPGRVLGEIVLVLFPIMSPCSVTAEMRLSLFHNGNE